MDNILEVKNISKEYKGFKLDNISFSIPKGTVMGLIGENGAGKSTTIKIILDLVNKDSGSVTFWGKNLIEDPKILKEDIGVVFDEINFYETLTPRKIEKISRLAYKQWDTIIFNDYMKTFSIPINKEIKTFSKGMKAKLKIAIALSHKAKILILDEPTSGLDPIVRDEILDILFEFIQNENHSILICSHITSDLEKIADYITFIHNGKVVFTKTKDSLIYNYGILKCGSELFNTLDKSDILTYRKKDYQYEVLIKDKENMKIKYKKSIIDNATIDDILLLYIKGDKK